MAAPAARTAAGRPMSSASLPYVVVVTRGISRNADPTASWNSVPLRSSGISGAKSMSPANSKRRRPRRAATRYSRNRHRARRLGSAAAWPRSGRRNTVPPSPSGWRANGPYRRVIRFWRKHRPHYRGMRQHTTAFPQVVWSDPHRPAHDIRRHCSAHFSGAPCRSSARMACFASQPGGGFEIRVR